MELMGDWEIVTSTPKTYQAEYGLPVPSQVDAAELDQTNMILYLIENNDVFTYTVTGTPPNSLSYTYTSTFDFSQNTANPFAAGGGSPLSSPPSCPHAMIITSDIVLVFSGANMFTYDKATQHWQQRAAMICAS